MRARPRESTSIGVCHSPPDRDYAPLRKRNTDADSGIIQLPISYHM
jgi:hypothetical protein